MNAKQVLKVLELTTEKRTLEPEQQAAAYEINKHISVTAGPGSGKTTVLVERYLHILRQHNPSIDQIVAITFTNRAANEMRERLRAELNKILANVKESERPRWLNYKRTLDGAVITTIHGFCARLLREFPVEAHVDPQFVLLDEHREAMLLESVVEEVLSEFIGGGHLEVSRLTLGFGRSRLAIALADIYRDLRGQGIAITDLALTTANNHLTEEDYDRILEDVEAAILKFLSVKRNTTAALENQLSVREAWANIKQSLSEIPSPDKLADYCRALEDFRKVRPPARGPLAEHVKALDSLIWNPNLGGSLPQVCFDVFARNYALEVVNLLSRIDEKLTDEKQKLSALDFDDLQQRALRLLTQPEVTARTSERYRFFLVDEFQDTNSLQKLLLERLSLSSGRAANLFIVGDPKQSIYGFRGADVDVFQQMTKLLVEAGGKPQPLQLNFRSQPPLIHFFNFLFGELFKPGEEIPGADLEQLGYVRHEESESKRALVTDGPLVEFLITSKESLRDPYRQELTLRELDAEQLAVRIRELVEQDGHQYSDIALLFRAMTQVGVYESIFRRANIPYQTVLGRGFYERPEITDLVQLLRFLDNKTDELALAAVLRSPLCGISDDALLALRCAPTKEQVTDDSTARFLNFTRNLFRALKQHHEIAFINDDEHRLLDRAADLLQQLIVRRHHYSIEELLRFAVDQSEFMTVVAANFDGAQRLANVERLFTLAARFERSGTHLIRGFVRYVEEFEAIGSRESEGQIDESANAVQLMTIHQAKGLEFPVVIIPDLHRLNRIASDSWFALDRHAGLTLKVPDGRGKSVAGSTYARFAQRAAWREDFENMRLLYVAATRAEDRLILSGATESLDHLDSRNDSWLNWIWKALKIQKRESGLIELDQDASLYLTLNLEEESPATISATNSVEPTISGADSLEQAFPLLPGVRPGKFAAINRFSVTQLINYQRCARQYYFDRVLKLTSADEIAIWNNAEAPEPPANLTATLKGAVIHRFCEIYDPARDIETELRNSFAEVVRLRQAQLSDRLAEIDSERAIKDLLPLAQHYLNSDVFSRIQQTRPNLKHGIPSLPPKAGLWSELPFKLRRPAGLLSGAIDKLLISQDADGKFQVEIIDFKTNRISTLAAPKSEETVHPVTQPANEGVKTKRRSISKLDQVQFAFEFEQTSSSDIRHPSESIANAVERVALDYKLQMQAYALAVRQLIPALAASQIQVTLHFLEPNFEYHLPQEFLEPEACTKAIDSAMQSIASSSVPEQFPPQPENHCRMCNFLIVCQAGRDWSYSSQG